MSESSDGDATPTRVRLDLAYDGTAFHGWAKQPGLRTVQGVLEAGLERLLARAEQPVALTVAGRTDVGVHATGQVVHLDLSAEQLAVLERRRGGEGDDREAVASLPRRLEGILRGDADVRVHRAELAAPGFDARFSAVWRRYEYRIADRAAGHDPRTRLFTYWHPSALDAAAMDDAARSLLGLHDFASFCKPREGATTIRALQSFGWRRDDDGVLVASLQADAFCHSMVRALVGACLAVGEERIGVDDAARLRDARARTSAFPVLAARGLTLTEVGYPPDAELEARASQTRARREQLTDDGSSD